MPSPLTLVGQGAFAATVQATAQGTAATALGTISTANVAKTEGGGYAANNTSLGSITGVNLAENGTAEASGTPAAITSINVLADGNGGYKFTDQNGNALSTAASTALFTVTAGTGTSAAQTGSSIAFTAGGALGATAPTGYGTVNSVAGNYGISTANIGIGDDHKAVPLPHHPACGSAPGGSRS